jgi:hypothetical protein
MASNGEIVTIFPESGFHLDAREEAWLKARLVEARFVESVPAEPASQQQLFSMPSYGFDDMEDMIVIDSIESSEEEEREALPVASQQHLVSSMPQPSNNYTTVMDDEDDTQSRRDWRFEENHARVEERCDSASPSRRCRQPRSPRRENTAETSYRGGECRSPPSPVSQGRVNKPRRRRNCPMNATHPLNNPANNGNRRQRRRRTGAARRNAAIRRQNGAFNHSMREQMMCPVPQQN